MTTYRNAFHNSNPYKSVGPEFFTTDATPIEYRGFLIYERIPTAGKFKYGEIDAVKNGMCVMISCTVIGAKTRIDNFLSGNGEDRARAFLKMSGEQLTIDGQVSDAHAFQLLANTELP